MKKRAFTMVELIFVIVILGILAAVAVPRLNASRADAKTAALKANLVTFAKDAEAYYAANGSYCPPGGDTSQTCRTQIADITNVPFDEISNDGFTGYFHISGARCLSLGAARYGTGLQVWTLWVSDKNPDCLKELDDKAYKDIKWVFTGYRDYNAGTGVASDPGDVREKPGNYARHWMNDPSKSVEW